MIDPIKKMDFDLKYDDGVLTPEFFENEEVKKQNVAVRLYENINTIFLTYGLNYNIREGMMYRNYNKKLFVVIKYTGFGDGCFNFEVRRANLIERVIGFFTIK